VLPEQVLQLLEAVATGKASPASALQQLAWQPVEPVHAADVASVAARLDHHRALRLGFPEVV
jgi:NCAIR mutase (PurE)-related protein